MNHLKRTLLTLGLAASLGATANFAVAEGPRHDDDRRGERHSERYAEKYEKKQEKRQEKRLEKMFKAVDATDAQQTNIKAISARYKTQIKQQRDAKKAIRKALMQLDPTSGSYDSQVNTYAQQSADVARNMVILKANQRREIAQQLTPEQRTTLKAKIQARMEKRQNR